MCFPENCGPNLSIDETALSKDELFTIVTNKDAHGGPGTLVAMMYGTKVSEIVAVLEEAIPAWRRLKVKGSDVRSVVCDDGVGQGLIPAGNHHERPFPCPAIVQRGNGRPSHRYPASGAQGRGHGAGNV